MLKSRKMMDQFQKLDPPHIDGDPKDYAHDYLDRCHKILCFLGLVESNGVDFTTFHVIGPTKRWCQTYAQEAMQYTWWLW